MCGLVGLILVDSNFCYKSVLRLQNRLLICNARRFQDFKNLEPLFNVLSSPFSAEAYSAPENIQLELLDVQADYDLKEKFKSVFLLEFYGSLPEAAFPHLKITLLHNFCLYLGPHTFVSKVFLI